MKFNMIAKILMIDDDQNTSDAFMDYLEMSDFEIAGSASNGKDGFEKYKQLKPDIVLLDIVMPDYDGFYAFEKIRDYDPQAKIVVLTAASRSTTQDRLMNMDCSALIFKPTSMDYLIDSLKIVLNGGKRMPTSTRSLLDYVKDNQD